MALPWTKCDWCRVGKTCPQHHIYIVWDDRRKLTRIGMSKNAKKRLSGYRKNGCNWFTLEYWAEAACEFQTCSLERKALLALEDVAPRRQGDWFDCQPATAIIIVKSVLGGGHG